MARMRSLTVGAKVKVVGNEGTEGVIVNKKEAPGIEVKPNELVIRTPDGEFKAVPKAKLVNI